MELLDFAQVMLVLSGVMTTIAAVVTIRDFRDRRKALLPQELEHAADGRPMMGSIVFCNAGYGWGPAMVIKSDEDGGILSFALAAGAPAPIGFGIEHCCYRPYDGTTEHMVWSPTVPEGFSIFTGERE